MRSDEGRRRELHVPNGTHQQTGTSWMERRRFRTKISTQTRSKTPRSATALSSVEKFAANRMGGAFPHNAAERHEATKQGIATTGGHGPLTPEVRASSMRSSPATAARRRQSALRRGASGVCVHVESLLRARRGREGLRGRAAFVFILHRVVRREFVANASGRATHR